MSQMPARRVKREDLVNNVLANGSFVDTEFYVDIFIILTRTPYSGVRATPITMTRASTYKI